MDNKQQSEEKKRKQQNQQEKLTQDSPELEQRETEEEQAAENEQEASVASAEDLLREELAILNDKHLRLMAEYENFRRRSQREKDAIYPQATGSVVEKLLPILDSFDRALDAPCSDDAFKKGLEMIFQNFMDVLTVLGVEEYGAIGEQFDPLWHNGVARVDNPDFGENEIVEVYQKGYRLGDKVLRTAMVVVAN